MGYLVDVSARCDGWMHRLDMRERLDGELVLTAEHDGRLVADVASDGSRRHGQSVDLELAGAAGGRFRFGRTGPMLTYDAITFCRLLSGRDGEPVLGTEVPFEARGRDLAGPGSPTGDRPGACARPVSTSASASIDAGTSP